MKNIPFVDLKAEFAPIKNEVMEAIESVFSGMNLNIGPNVRALEQEFADYCGTEYAVGVGSGTEAIFLALLSAGVEKGDEIIVSPHTFFATVEAIAYAGAVPVFVDIESSTYAIDASRIEQSITPRTKAVIPVHMYGHPVDMGPVMKLSEKYGIKVIEDACQAHGALYNDKKTGNIGHAGCFSFYFTKNLGGYGEGGMITTNSAELADKARLYRNHGHRSKYEHALIGYNSRLDEIQAAVLRIKLKRLDDYNEQRRTKASVYRDLLKGTPLVLPVQTADCRHVYHLYVVRAENRDGLQKYLADSGIGTGIHYKVPVHLQEACRHFGYKAGDVPEVEKACKEILSLPMYPALKEEDISYIAEKIKEFYS